MSSKVCYFNDGLSFRWVMTGYVAQPGEVLFPVMPTVDQLAAAFTKYSAASTSKTLVLQAMRALPDTDTTMLRIVEAVSLGHTTWITADVLAWVNYRRALRAIISSGTGAMPVKPAYPAGT